MSEKAETVSSEGVNQESGLDSWLEALEARGIRPIKEGKQEGERFNEFHAWTDKDGKGHLYAGPALIHGSVRVVIREEISTDEALRLLGSILDGLSADWPNVPAPSESSPERPTRRDPPVEP